MRWLDSNDTDVPPALIGDEISVWSGTNMVGEGPITKITETTITFENTWSNGSKHSLTFEPHEGIVFLSPEEFWYTTMKE